MDFSKEELAPFNLEDPAYRRKLWVRVVTPDNIYYHVFWRRIGAALLVLAFAGWLTLAGAAWAFVKYRRGYEGVSYFDLAFYPLRRDAYRAKLGRHFITEGQAALKKQNFREGYSYLIAGISRVPQDIEARKLIAMIEAQIGRTDRALSTLRGGVEFARNDLEYLRLLFGYMLGLQEDEQVIALAHQLLPNPPDRTAVNQFIALQAATAHHHRGRTEQVQQIVRDWRLDQSLEGQILLARCDWQQGLRALALAKLERQLPLHGRRDELFVELIKLHREAGNTAEARRFALLRQFNDPAGPGPRIDLIHTYRASGDTVAEQRELAEYLQRFKADEKAMLQLAWFGLDTAQPALVDHVHAIAVSKGFSLEHFELARVTVALAARDYAKAAELADSALKSERAPAVQLATLLNALRAVALFGLGDPTRGQVMLNAFLEASRVRATDALLLARHFRLLGFPAQSRRVLERACQLDPRNETALAELIRLDSETGNRAALAENLPKLAAMRKHVRGALEETLRHLNEPADAPLRDQIRAALDAPGP